MIKKSLIFLSAVFIITSCDRHKQVSLGEVFSETTAVLVYSLRDGAAVNPQRFAAAAQLAAIKTDLQNKIRFLKPVAGAGSLTWSGFKKPLGLVIEINAEDLKEAEAIVQRVNSVAVQAVFEPVDYLYGAPRGLMTKPVGEKRTVLVLEQRDPSFLRYSGTVKNELITESEKALFSQLPLFSIRSFWLMTSGTYHSFRLIDYPLEQSSSALFWDGRYYQSVNKVKKMVVIELTSLAGESIQEIF